jgi:hypothetical protein
LGDQTSELFHFSSLTTSSKILQFKPTAWPFVQLHVPASTTNCTVTFQAKKAVSPYIQLHL